MSTSFSRRTILQISGVAGLAGVLGTVGVAPASAINTINRIPSMQSWADKLNKASVGYDQDQRWTFLNKSSRTFVSGRECDCSSSCGAIAWLAGFKVDLDGLYTGNFAAKFKAAGFSIIDYTSLSKVKTGDFVLTPGHHVVFVRDANRWWSAEADENGHATGGKAGDQTGSECRYRAPYTRPGGWTYIVRPNLELSYE